MIEIYAWNTKIFKIVKRKAKLNEIPPLAGQKKNQGQGIIKQFSCCLLRLWAGKINGNKKNFQWGRIKNEQYLRVILSLNCTRFKNPYQVEFLLLSSPQKEIHQLEA